MRKMVEEVMMPLLSSCAATEETVSPSSMRTCTGVVPLVGWK